MVRFGTFLHVSQDKNDLADNEGKIAIEGDSSSLLARLLHNQSLRMKARFQDFKL